MDKLHYYQKNEGKNEIAPVILPLVVVFHPVVLKIKLSGILKRIKLAVLAFIILVHALEAPTTRNIGPKSTHISTVVGVIVAIGGFLCARSRGHPAIGKFRYDRLNHRETGICNTQAWLQHAINRIWYDRIAEIVIIHTRNGVNPYRGEGADPMVKVLAQRI